MRARGFKRVVTMVDGTRVTSVVGLYEDPAKCSEDMRAYKDSVQLLGQSTVVTPSGDAMSTKDFLEFFGIDSVAVSVFDAEVHSSVEVARSVAEILDA